MVGPINTALCFTLSRLRRSQTFMALPSSTTVLIVGAGPTGLSAAISLLNQGVDDIVIVDAVLKGENTSRAMAVHAATLEVCCKRPGCVDFIFVGS